MPTPSPATEVALATTSQRVAETARVFLRLGLNSFGGPVAHLGYFHREFVERHRWLSNAAYAKLVALCQFLPGPTSSQAGLALELQRAGWVGASGRAGRTVRPKAGRQRRGGTRAVWGMARTLCPDALRRALALALLAVLYRASALVFGGGHVVLPLPQAAVVPRGWLPLDGFLAGYGAAQAVPGLRLGFAAFVGAARTAAPSGWPGGRLALAAVNAVVVGLLAGAALRLGGVG